MQDPENNMGSKRMVEALGHCTVLVGQCFGIPKTTCRFVDREGAVKL